MLRLFVVGVGLLAGCDTVFGLTRDTPQDASIADARDGAVDARAQLHCSTMSPPPEFCFDFDDNMFTGYQRGNGYLVSPAANGIVVDRRPPGFSEPNALWFTAASPGYGYVVKGDDQIAVHAIAASLRLRATTGTDASRPIEVLSVAMEGGGTCRAVLTVDNASLALSYSLACNGDYASVALGALDDDFRAVTLSFDRLTGQGMATLGGTGQPIKIAGVMDGPMNPSIIFGIPIAQDAGLVVAFDDIVVTAE